MLCRGSGAVLEGLWVSGGQGPSRLPPPLQQLRRWGWTGHVRWVPAVLSRPPPLLPRCCAQCITGRLGFAGVQLVHHVPAHLSALQGSQGLRSTDLGKRGAGHMVVGGVSV